jgi:hypothetical protein
MSYIGRNLRNRFPLWSEVRRNESSNAAMLLDSIGDGLEEERVSFFQTLKASFSLQGNPTPELGHFFRFTQFDEAYHNYVKNNSIFENIDAEGIKGSETFYLEPKYSYRDMVMANATRAQTSFNRVENVKLVSIVEDETALDENSHAHFIKSIENKNNTLVLTDTFDFKNEYKKIYIKIDKSKNYRSFKDAVNFNEHYSIVLRGQDETRRTVEETIEINDDGIYVSKTWFKSLEPSLEENEHRGGGSIEIYGLTGDIKIYSAPVENDFIINDNSTIVKISNELGYDTLIENNCKYSLTHEEAENELVSFLNYNFRSYIFGSDYKDVTAGMEGDFFEETISKRVFVNEDLTPMKIDSFALDTTKNRIVTISKDFILREYNPYRDSFNSKLIKRTKEIDLSFEVENQRVFLNENIKMNLFLEKAKGGIQFLFIGRHTPERRLSYEENSDFNFEFLQQDLSWGDSFDYFEGKYSDNIYEEFENIQFECNHEETGQYDYYVFSFKDFLVDREYLNKVKTGAIQESAFKALVEANRESKDFDGSLNINSYSTMCEEIAPLFSLDLEKDSILNEVRVLEGIPVIATGSEEGNLHSDNYLLQDAPSDFISLEDYTLAIWFENTENSLYLSVNYQDRHYIFNINRFYDCIFYDYETGSGVVIEDYDEVNVVVNGNIDVKATKTDSVRAESLKKVRNSTWIDEVGFNYGVSRELNESLNNYRHRLVNLVNGTLTKEKHSFYKSLGYITSLNDVDVFRVTKVDETDSVRIDITSNRIYIYKDDELQYMNRFENIKFLKDFYEVLLGIDFLQVEVLEPDDSWWYKKTENLMPCSSDRQTLSLSINSQSKKISNKYIKSIKDLSGDFINNVPEEQIVNPYNFSLEDGVLHKYKLAEEKVTYNYEDFPFIIKWLPIKSCAIIDPDFEDLIKESFYDNEKYGEITVAEEKPTEKLLSQKGSVIINKILDKQNTYWGE